MKKVSLIVFVFFLGCVYDPPSGLLEIVNMSDKPVYVFATCNDSIKRENELHMFFIDSSGQKYDTTYPNYRIKPHDTGPIYIGGTKNKPKIFCEDRHVTIFIIEESILRDKNWDDICKYQLYVKKTSYSQQELERLNWKISYNHH